MRLFVLTRHAESTLNHEGRVNGDPAVPVGLTAAGEEQAGLLGLQLAGIPLAGAVHTRFERTRRTAELALAGRDVPLVEEPLLDDVDVGGLEGRPIEDYRAWKRVHERGDPFPGGESLDEAARRYARALRGLLETASGNLLVVLHEIPLRYALNGAAGSGELDGPVRQLGNAQPFLFDEQRLARAVSGIDVLTIGKHPRRQ